MTVSVRRLRIIFPRLQRSCTNFLFRQHLYIGKLSQSQICITGTKANRRFRHSLHIFREHGKHIDTLCLYSIVQDIEISIFHKGFHMTVSIAVKRRYLLQCPQVRYGIPSVIVLTSGLTVALHKILHGAISYLHSNAIPGSGIIHIQHPDVCGNACIFHCCFIAQCGEAKAGGRQI